MKGGFLSGYKTYVMAALAVIGAAAAWAMGEMTLADAIQQAWAGGVAATIRAGISSEA